MVRRGRILLALLVLGTALPGCGLLTSGSDSASNVDVVAPDREYPEGIPTPARGAEVPGRKGGAEGTEDLPAASTTTAKPLPTTTGVPVTEPAVIPPPVPLEPVVPPPTVTPTTIDLSRQTPWCVTVLRFYQAGNRLFDEAPRASSRKIEELMSAAFISMDRLKPLALESLVPLIDEMLTGRALLADMSSVSATAARRRVNDFIEAKRQTINSFLYYAFGSCPEIGVIAASDTPPVERGWIPPSTFLGIHFGGG